MVCRLIHDDDNDDDDDDDDDTPSLLVVLFILALGKNEPSEFLSSGNREVTLAKTVPPIGNR